jgi:hypothetical protein
MNRFVPFITLMLRYKIANFHTFIAHSLHSFFFCQHTFLFVLKFFSFPLNTISFNESLLLVTMFVLVLFYLFKTLHSIFYVPYKIQRHFRNQGISGPTYRPIFGNSSEIKRLYSQTKSEPNQCNHNILKRVIPFYQRWSSKYGKTFLYWFGSNPQLAISDPDMIKEVLVTKNISNGAIINIKVFCGSHQSHIILK